MKFGVVDCCVVVGIIGCSYYLWDQNSRDYIWAAEYSAGEENNVPETDNPVVHSSRNCDASGEKSLVVVLELMYSGLLPLDVDATGDQIMKNLFSQCTCTLSSDYCFQWTLTINQMNYSITDNGRCGASSCRLSAAETFPANQINATLGLIHPIVPPSSIVPSCSLSCLQRTVLCALNTVDPQIVTNTYVQAVLSSAKENTT